MYEDRATLVVAGDCVHQHPGVTHYLFDYSQIMKYFKDITSADFTSVEVAGPCAIPRPMPWVSMQ